jgi:hypothetical protein
MTTTTVEHLTTVITHWDNLTDALDSVSPTWPPAALRAHVARLDHQDRAEETGLRALERSPEQLGATAAPLRIDILDTMRDVETVLVGCADYIAAAVQRSPMPRAPRTWPATDRARRDQLADADAADPRRWRYTGHRPAPYAAAWLAARVDAHPGGPFAPLTLDHRDTIGRAARAAGTRIERVLDLTDDRRTLTRPCACGGTIEIHGGAGATPVARCTGCGAIWSERGVIAA